MSTDDVTEPESEQPPSFADLALPDVKTFLEHCIA